MADTTGKYIIQQKQADGMLTLYPQTTADQVILDSATAGMSSTNVQDAFKEVMDTIDGVTGGGVVTGVKGNAEQEYRKGQVNLTPAIYWCSSCECGNRTRHDASIGIL